MQGRWRAARLAAAALAIAACSSDAAPPPPPNQPSTPSLESTSTSTSTTALPPVFRSAVVTVTATDLHSSWRPGCPVPVDELRAVDATYWGFDGEVHEGRLVVATDVALVVEAVLGDLFEARYPIERMEPVDGFGGDDIASVLANNTSGFNCRVVAGTTSVWSEHAYGRAVDLNPRVNPYITSRGRVIPEESTPYVDREQDVPGMIRDGDAAVVAFEARGWIWGGHWDRGTDYQHFSTTGA